MVINPWKTTVSLWDEKMQSAVTVELSITIAWDAIARRLARRAIKSKHARASELHGAVKAKIVGRS